jgi:hypothetical protein
MCPALERRAHFVGVARAVVDSSRGFCSLILATDTLALLLAQSRTSAPALQPSAQATETAQVRPKMTKADIWADQSLRIDAVG